MVVIVNKYPGFQFQELNKYILLIANEAILSLIHTNGDQGI